METKKINVLFDIVQEYYWPAMKPIYDVMQKDSRFDLSLRIGPNQRRFLGIFLLTQRETIEEKHRKLGFKVTREHKDFDAVICGDTLKYPESYGKAFLCNVDHGPCFKTLRYRNLLKQPTTPYVVFAEGPYRMKKLKEHGLDKIDRVFDVGLPKLDPFFTGGYDRDTIIKRHKLDPNKKIVLYAPTYKPTSLYEVAKSIWKLTSKYNVIIKLHPYSWTGKYAPHKQHRIYEKLVKKYPDLVLVSPTYHDIMPYLFAADTMISEASSVINEYLVLERCGIIYDLPDDKLKHSDGEPLLAEKTTDWLKNSYVHINKPEDLEHAVEQALNPNDTRKAALKRDKEWIFSVTDGSSSSKVKEIVEKLVSERDVEIVV